MFNHRKKTRWLILYLLCGSYLLKTAQNCWNKQEARTNLSFFCFFYQQNVFGLCYLYLFGFFTLLKEIFLRSSSHCRQISQTQRPTQRNANFGCFGCLLQLLFEVFGFDFVGQTHTETGWVTHARSPIQAETWIRVSNWEPPSGEKELRTSTWTRWSEAGSETCNRNWCYNWPSGCLAHFRGDSVNIQNLYFESWINKPVFKPSL